MNNIYNIYSFNGNAIFYVNLNDAKNFTNEINNYKKNIKFDVSNNKIYLIIHNNDNQIKTSNNIFIHNIDINFDLFFELHKLRHNYFYKNKINNIDEIINLYNLINIPHDVLKDKYPNLTNKLNNNKHTIQLCQNNINEVNNIIDKIQQLNNNTANITLISYLINNFKCIETMDIYIDLKNKLKEILNNFIPNNIFNFDVFNDSYIYNSSKNIFCDNPNKNICLENVYYINKSWFDINKKPFTIKEFELDLEYSGIKNNTYYKKFNNIDNIKVFQNVNEEVMYLDYKHGFYNFGEFWDCLKRLMKARKKNLKLFHVSGHRVNNINEYFNKLEFIYPSEYQTQENNNKLYFFKKINISILRENTCRGEYNLMYSYNFNQIFNNTPMKEDSYNIYLKRGAYGRNMLNEKELIDILISKHNFIIIDGTQSHTEMLNYFSNAKIILGIHGSLFKNTIFCKKNPLIIELCPISRHTCFVANSLGCKFQTIFTIIESDEKEQLVLSKEKSDYLINLIDILNKN